MKVMAGPQYNALIGEYVAKAVNANITNTPFQGFAVFDEQDNLCAGIVVSNFRGTDCELSIAAETARWAKKGVCQYIFDYVFNKLGCIRCTSIIQKIPNTRRARKFAEGMGFVLEGNLRLAYDGKTDALVYGLLRAECRFLEGYQGGTNGEKVRAKRSRPARPVRGGAGADAAEQGDSDSAS